MEVKDLQIPGNGYTLAATVVIPSQIIKQQPAVIFYHGMVSQSKPRNIKRAKKLAEKGVLCLCFDFRGCGESEGKLGEISLADWFSDALLAFDFLASYPGIDPRRIGINGKSFGGYMGALVSEKRIAKSMVLQAPAVYPDSLLDQKYMLYKTSGNAEKLKYRNSKDALNNMAIRAIEQYKNPLLIVGSELDTVCPKHTVFGYYHYAGSMNKKIMWIKNADHPLTKDKWNNEYIHLLSDWFEKTL